MSDIHQLPLLGHDMPHPAAPGKVRVFKAGPYWTWEHSCGCGSSIFDTHRMALRWALHHLKRCP